MSYAFAQPVAQPFLIQQQQPLEGVAVENNKRMEESFVGKWFFALKAMCICTFVFAVFALFFSFLNEYDEKGNKIKDGTTLKSLEGATLFLFGFPVVFPLFVVFFFKAESFARERFNRGRNLSGETKSFINGKDVTRMVFGNKEWASFVTISVWLCFIFSFSVFFSYGIPRCKKENKELNTGWLAVPSKFACEIAFRFGFVQFIIAVIIVVGTIALWYRFYWSLPMPARNKGRQQASNAAKGLARGAISSAAVSGGAVVAVGGMSKRAIKKQIKKLESRQQRRQSRPEQAPAALMSPPPPDSPRPSSAPPGMLAAKTAISMQATQQRAKNRAATMLQAAARGVKAREQLKKLRTKAQAASIK